MSELTQEYLKECFHYHPDTGTFTWLERPVWHFKDASYASRGNARLAGKKVKCVNSSGYIVTNFKGRLYYLHRLAWVYVYGISPSGEIDHINGSRTDNRLCNLRNVSRVANSKNAKRSSRNTSGCTGVSWARRNSKWVAMIRVDKRQTYLGLFADKADAIAARKTAEKKYGYHPNHGRST